MALQLKFDLCVINNCTQIRFSENTGFYNPTNLGGYGTPNLTGGSVTTAVLTITNPAGTVYTLDLFATTIFPSNILYTSYDIPLASIGSPTSIVDGKWTFSYAVSNGITTYTTSVFKYFYCSSACCVKQMLANLDLSCDCCKDSTEYKTYELAWVQLQALKKAAACGDETNFTAIKKIIDKLCLNSGCKTCK
mgnify:FL=1